MAAHHDEACVMISVDDRMKRPNHTPKILYSEVQMIIFLNHKIVRWFLYLLILALGPSQSHAAEYRHFIAGVRHGTMATFGKQEDFKQYDCFGRVSFPWQWELLSKIVSTVRLTATIGILEGGGDTGMIGSVSPSMVFGKKNGRISVEIGAGGALLGRQTYGAEYLGGTFQFVNYIGILFRLHSKWSLNYRFQHMSNADIYTENPGLDFHFFEASYRF